MNLTPEGKDRLDAMKKALAEKHPLTDLAKDNLEKTLKVWDNAILGRPIRKKRAEEQDEQSPLPHPKEWPLDGEPFRADDECQSSDE